MDVVHWTMIIIYEAEIVQCFHRSITKYSRRKWRRIRRGWIESIQLQSGSNVNTIHTRNSCNCVYIDHLCFSSLSPFLVPDFMYIFIGIYIVRGSCFSQSIWKKKKTNGDENNEPQYKMRNKFAIETELDTNFNCVTSVLQSAEG